MVVVAAPSKSRSRARSKAKLEVTSETRWIGFSTSKLSREGFGHLLVARLAHVGIAEPSITVVDSLSAQKRLVEAGLGLGFLPLSSVRDELGEGSLVELDLQSISTQISVTLVHRRVGYLSPAAKDLITRLASMWDGKTARWLKSARS